MHITRNGKDFNVVQQNGTIVLERCTFDQAREFLANNGNKDAGQELWNHARTRRGEKIGVDTYASGPIQFKDRSF